ncbi:bifunctional 2-keto-4-hydroxyglutarate aldolase/2-keto-3-deoxy-6-phosphogluconate aldolase [Liquorilactobacillus satsumensis]|uniref:bifunctional 2-keto-4-hydroxyglutarate aldolase/2-keto-3-deoxy-6-phosphogluconate aldolase n=1 Tax=Liquorilactobacillus satsumensis TaxID=259059 RepID=UPI0021C3A391|nr:bifunctional 2-keto-4-hydroxyglutarate aldolase/2-keto-3-deoxy-6-phosphogluconate aldolase [Liquorilactobacillus satsumensis]MCP9329053.1 bifunctional 2-keto-4-hydroxyglutarate aldolase/2-keto-3-deoxy-6-phosphogluconate aldolase [Liquorilactobacillus satsumensis]
MLQKSHNLEKLHQAGVIAVIRATSSAEAIAITEAVIKGGITGIELTFTVPQATDVIAQLNHKYHNPQITIGAGTVLDAVSARLAIIAGAEFIVSPTFNVEVAKICNLYQIPYTPGCQTVTEMQTALENGVDLIKLFPGAITGPSMVKAVLAPLPQLNIMPTGGVKLSNLAEWFAAGVVAVGAGSNLLQPAAQGDLAGVTANAQKYVAELASIRKRA